MHVFTGATDSMLSPDCTTKLPVYVHAMVPKFHAHAIKIVKILTCPADIKQSAFFDDLNSDSVRACNGQA